MSLNWTWNNDNRICDDCDWIVIAEKDYYWCIGCERTIEKHPWFDEMKAD